MRKVTIIKTGDRSHCLMGGQYGVDGGCAHGRDVGGGAPDFSYTIESSSHARIFSLLASVSENSAIEVRYARPSLVAAWRASDR